MALTLNTADALASSLTYLIGVDDDNTIKFFKGGLTATPGANVSIQTGTYGRAFRTGAARSADSLVTWPLQQINNVTPITVFVAYNQYNSASVISTGISALMFSGRLDGTAGTLMTGLQMDIGNGQWMPHTSTTGRTQSEQDASNTNASAITTAGAHSIAYRTNSSGATSVAAFLDGVLDTHFNPNRTNAGSLYGSGSSTATFQGIGGNVVGATAQSALSLDYVYVAIWVGATVSDAEIARLHASLTGGNAFALVTEAVPASFAGAVTLDDVAPSGGFSAAGVSSFTGSVTLDDAAPGGSFGPAGGTFTSPPLNSNNGTALVSAPLSYVAAYDATTGALVARFTGLTTDSLGRFTVSSALLSPGATLRWDWETAAGQRRMPLGVVA